MAAQDNHTAPLQQFNANHFALLLSGTLFGFIPIIATILTRTNGYHAIELIFGRLSLAGVVAFVIIIYYCKKLPSLSEFYRLYNWRVIFFQGLLLVLMIYVYFFAIALGIAAGEAAFLVQVQPIVTISLSVIIFHERLSQNQWFALLAGILGIIFLTHIWDISLGSNIPADCLAMSNGILYSMYLLIGKYEKVALNPYSKTNLYKFQRAMLVFFFAAVINISMTIPFFLIMPSTDLLFGLRITIFTESVYLIGVILLAFFATLIPYGMIIWASPKVTGSQMALLLLMEPISAVIAGSIILNQPMTIYYLIGGFLIGIAMWLSNKSVRS